MADQMSWKKAVFFGGAVLVLSACADTTAPSSPSELTKLDRASVSASKKTQDAAPATLTIPPPEQAPTSCAAAVIHVGFDGELIVTCPPVMW